MHRARHPRHSRRDSRAAARICTSSRPYPRYRANTTSGRCSRSSICRCGSRTRESAVRARRRGPSLGLLDERRHRLAQDRHQLPGGGGLAAPCHAFARHSRADVRRALQRSGRRRHITEHAIDNVPTPGGKPAPGSAERCSRSRYGVGNPDLNPEEADTMTAGFVVAADGHRPAAVGRLVQHRARRCDRPGGCAEHRQRVQR